MWIKTGKINKKGQNLIEYGLILGIVAMALISMQTYFKRSLQSVVKVVADDYGPQRMPIRQVEVNVKEPLYAARDQITSNTTVNNAQTRTAENLGDSNIRTTTTVGATSYQSDSYAVSGDFRTK